MKHTVVQRVLQWECRTHSHGSVVTFHDFKIASQLTKPEEYNINIQHSSWMGGKEKRKTPQYTHYTHTHTFLFVSLCYRVVISNTNFFCCCSLRTRVLITTTVSCSISWRRPLTCLTPLTFCPFSTAESKGSSQESTFRLQQTDAEFNWFSFNLIQNIQLLFYSAQITSDQYVK